MKSHWNWLEAPISPSWMVHHHTYVLSLTMSDHFQLTTFNTSWGQYHFVCIPWWLACAQDIFQCIMSQIFESCNDMSGITDYVIFHGTLIGIAH